MAVSTSESVQPQLSPPSDVSLLNLRLQQIIIRYQHRISLPQQSRGARRTQRVPAHGSTVTYKVVSGVDGESCTELEVMISPLLVVVTTTDRRFGTTSGSAGRERASQVGVSGVQLLV